MATRPQKPDIQETRGWRWVKVSDDLLEQMREYGEPVRVKVESGPEQGEVIITFQRVEEGT